MDSFDIALAADKTDIVASVYDGTPVDPNYKNKINFSKSFAFENYSLYTDPMIYEYSTIDVPPSHKPVTKSAEADYFTLFEFSAKWDPVPTMLTQDHVGVVNGFMGQTTGFNRNMLKKHVVVLGKLKMMIWLNIFMEMLEEVHLLFMGDTTRKTTGILLVILQQIFHYIRILQVTG